VQVLSKWLLTETTLLCPPQETFGDALNLELDFPMNSTTMSVVVVFNTNDKKMAYDVLRTFIHSCGIGLVKSPLSLLGV